MFLVNMMFYTAALNIRMNKYRQYPNTGFIGLDPDIGDTEFLLESIEWFIECQTFSVSYDLAFSTHPFCKLSLFLSLPVCRRSSLGEGEEVNQEAWPSLNLCSVTTI